VRRWSYWLVLLLAVGVHGQGLIGDVWPKVRDAAHARDFASYYYAAQAAAQDRNPYDTRVLGRLARQDGTRRGVHPFFYPPPYLLTVAWVLPLELSTAYRTWFVLDSLFLLAVLLALIRWLPGPATVLSAALILVTYTPIPDNHWMGQANLPVLALVVGSLGLLQRGHARVAGALMGLAAMMKMSPGLIVLWWLLDPARRRAAWVACGTAIGLSVLALPLVGPDVQAWFYTQVLPGFATGDYNGLTVPITLSGNHSIANLWAQAFPGDGLTAAARWGSRVSTIGLAVGTLAALHRVRDAVWADPIRLACASGALVCWMVLIPAYTYEHHLVFLILPWVAVANAVASRQLPWGCVPVLIGAYGALAWRLGAIRSALRDLDGAAHLALQEAKFLSIAVLGCACLVVALRRPAVAPRAAGPGSDRGPASTAPTGPTDSGPAGGTSTG